MAGIITPQARLNGRAIRAERTQKVAATLYYVGLFAGVAYLALVAAHIGLTLANGYDDRPAVTQEQALVMGGM